jgi:hypothetical protein
MHDPLVGEVEKILQRGPRVGALARSGHRLLRVPGSIPLVGEDLHGVVAESCPTLFRPAVGRVDDEFQEHPERVLIAQQRWMRACADRAELEEELIDLGCRLRPGKSSRILLKATKRRLSTVAGERSV